MKNLIVHPACYLKPATSRRLASSMHKPQPRFAVLAAVAAVALLVLGAANHALAAGTASVTLRPSYVDISSTTSPGAVLLTLSGYTADSAPKYRLYNGSNQYNCWDPASGTFVTSTSYGSGPAVPGDYVNGTTFWILYQRGNNNSTVASYRDRVSPYSANNNTVALSAATAMSSPFNLTGTVAAGGGYDLTVRYVVLGFDSTSGGTLLCASFTDLTTGSFTLVCHGGTAVRRVEFRTISNTTISAATQTGTWTATTALGTINLGAAAPTVTIDNTGAPATGNISAGTSDVALFGFRLAPSGSVDFTALSLTTAGTANSSDLSNFRVVYDADNSGTYNGGDSIVSASGQSLASPINFTISGQTGFSAGRRYLVIADVASGATAGHTFTASIPSATGVTTTGNETGSATGNQQTIVAAANSVQSDIIRASGFTEPANVAYGSYQATDITSANSIEMARFTIRDGGGSADSDSASTTLTAISFSVANGGILRRVALYDGTSEVAEVAGGTTVSFGGFSGLVAADGGTKNFSVRATFNASVTDNEQLQFTVSSATADSGGSMFATGDAGGAASDTTGDANRIEVTATKLVLSSVPSSVTVGQNFTITVQAQDANSNMDLDSNTSVTVSKASGGGTLSSVAGLTQSLAGGTKTWPDVQIDTAGLFTIQAAGGSLTTATSGSITASVLLLEEDFDYTAEDNITSHGWTAHNAVGTNPIKVKSPGLSYAGYASSGIGLAASMTTSGEDDHKDFAAAPTAGSVYAAFLVNASAAQTTGDYFFHFYETSSLLDGRVFIKKDASSSSFAFGLSKANEGATYTGFDYSLDTTYLVVVKYTFNGSSQDDTVALFVNPIPGGSEPTATVGPLTASINDATSLVAVALRQGTAASMPTVVVDGIRVGTTWADVVACAPPTTSAITGDSAVAIGQMGKTYSVTLTSGSSYAWTVPSGASITAGATGPDNNQITVTFGSASGNVTVTETASGGCVGSPVSLAVTVTGNHAPVAPAVKTLGTVKNTAATYAYVKLLSGATDADIGDTLTVTAASTPTAHGTTSLETDGVRYTPATDYTGPDSYTYTISDGNGGTAVGTVNVTVVDSSGVSPNIVVPASYAGGKFSVTFAGIPGVTYTVEYATTLPPTSDWNKLKNVTAGDDGLFVVEDAANESPSRYYRTVWPAY